MGQFSPVGRLGMPEAQKYKLEGGACPTQHTVLSCLKRKSCSNSSKAWGKNIANCNPPEIIFFSCKAVPLQETTKPWAHTKLEHAERRNKIWEPVWKAPGQNGLQRFVLLEDGTRFHLVALNHLLSPTCALSCCQPSKAFWRLDNLVQPTPNLSDWAFFFSNPFCWCFDSLFFLSELHYKPHSLPIVGPALHQNTEPAFCLDNTTWPRKPEIDARPQD